ncbi:growth factor receptor-bound protein 7 isoform X6 [Erinaceus europaeus]|uniref:Growth factor receptor-bound protein 7 isoform X6 n=1 Tax=Erinaceus europaeus TaxID=9365 RepID=A0ABM3YEQ2_ERIEU|nr:growth factor receptor-bound protein 7 isoform X6 [Erinaceus europaeus]
MRDAAFPSQPGARLTPRPGEHPRWPCFLSALNTGPAILPWGQPDVMELGLSPPLLNNSPEELYLSPGTPPRTPPPPDGPLSREVKRSQPLPIPAGRKLLREEELRATSLPSIPNPFPELCSPPSQSPILGGSSGTRGLLPRDASRPHVIKVYSEDGACRSVEVAAGATARYVCEMLVQRAHALSDENWGLVECHPQLALERGLEDHESVVEVQAAWPIGGDSRFVFRKNFAKYELFKTSPHSLFPEKMVSSCLDAKADTSHEDLIQNFLNAGSFPEIQGFLQLRGSGRKLWKRFFCFLRRSGLYYSTKGTSKPNKLRNGHKGLHIFCSEDEQSRTCWLAAFRLFKKKTNHRLSLPTPSSGSSLSAAIHRTQPWFHGRISREESQRLIGQQGLVDGLFLVRESQRNPQGFVLSLCHLQKVKHYLILPQWGLQLWSPGEPLQPQLPLTSCPLWSSQSEEEGRLYFSMDEGQTRFTDLLQLVEFHQLNRGILPCVLRHTCTRVAL